jgi:phytoene desaturase
MPVTAIIGSGFSGLSAAAYLSAAGHEVHVYEKNAEPGGRARQITTSGGYVFDMGPSWYWMPDVFEKFFADFHHTASDFYDLKLLDPSFEMVFGKNDSISVPADFSALCEMFDAIEPNSSGRLIQFMKEAEIKYRIGMEKFVYQPSLSIREFMSPEILMNALQLNLFRSHGSHIRKYFSDPRLLALMEFPILFLGGTAENIPALYTLMNYAGLKLGTWYPMGGFGKVIEAMKNIAEKQGAHFHFNATVEKIQLRNRAADSLLVNGKTIRTDGIIAAADYEHVENHLLPPSVKNYKNGYWNHKVFAPSCLIFYLGINKTIPRLLHHTLFFDESLSQHGKEIYDQPQWPTKPLFYVCCPSKTDPGVAPSGHENIFMLMPIAPGLKDTDEIREHYFEIMMDRLETFCGTSIRSYIDYKKSYCINDFIHDYNSFKGNAYGLANTLKQTAMLRPTIRNKKIHNLFYAGQLTVPGPGVPPSIISGKIAADLLNQSLIKA